LGPDWAVHLREFSGYFGLLPEDGQILFFPPRHRHSNSTGSMLNVGWL
jgi:hypothetical protein